MTIRPPKYSSQGFTLIEMIVTVMVAGILMALATPSLLSLNKPLRDGSLQFKSQLSLIRSKAISSSKAYRIRPKFTTTAELNANSEGRARNFVVEYADNCKMPENDFAPASLRWQMASQFDLDLPPNIGIITTGTLSLTDNTPTTTTPPAPAITNAVTASLDWKAVGSRICFDSRGILDGTGTKRIVLKDFQGFNKAKLAELEITKVGSIDVKAYVENTSSTFTTTDSSTPDNPSF